MFREDFEMNRQEYLAKLNKKASEKKTEDILAFALEEFKDKLSFASSMGAEDQVITHMMANITKSFNIFTLDTGRLFQETCELIEKTNSRYKINIEVYFPDAEKVQKMVSEKGMNLFYNSIENRKLCCFTRKILPLKRALAGKTAWVTGLRKEQAPTRSDISTFEWDETNQLIKINPLIHWTEQEIWDYIKQNNIPYNALHDSGFKSIGCLPCTRAVEAGEDARAGRWWWENQGHKECGLHKR